MSTPLSVRIAAASLLAACLLAPAVALDVPTQLTGRVLLIRETAQSGLVADLAQLGVTIGTPVTIDYTIDDTSVASPNQQVSTTYLDSVVTLVVAAGQYEARYDRQPADVGKSTVTVTNDRGAGATVDGYTVQATVFDNDVVGAGTLQSPLTAAVTLLDGTAAAISDEEIIQDASRFPGLGSVVTLVGANGNVVIQLDDPAPKGDTGRCTKAQLAAAGKLASSVLKCRAKWAGQPASKDPADAKVAACIDKARGKFTIRFAKAILSADRKGQACRFEIIDAGPTADSLIDDLSDLVDSLLVGADRDDKTDRGLRLKILKAAASQAGKDLAAHGKAASKPNPAKLQAQLASSRTKAIRSIDKALSKAQKKGADTTGLDSADIVDAVRQLTQNHAAVIGGD